MEETFEVRVKRLFGSQLFESVPLSSFPESSWSVADGEVERKEWNRDPGAGPDRSDYPCSSAFAEGGCYAKKRSTRRASKQEFESDMDEFDDDADTESRKAVEEEEEEEEEKDEGDDRNAEESEIRSFVGLDPTLDNEKLSMVLHLEPWSILSVVESFNYSAAIAQGGLFAERHKVVWNTLQDEEDEFDRAALGKDDDAGERLYMRDVKNRGPHLNYHCIFADVVEAPYAGSYHFYKDPRADHFAAGVRLEEEKKAAENYSVPNYSKDEHPSSTTGLLEDIKLKPILKRKEAHDDSKPKKRVRFDPGCKADNDEVPTQDSAMFSLSMEVPAAAAADPNPVMLEESPGLPDYVRNPSKYTHYTFDSYEDDDLANISAFEDLQNVYKKLNPEQLHQQFTTVEPPKSITFSPRRKSIDAMPVDNESGDIQENRIRKEFLQSDLWVCPSVGIAAAESYEGGVCKMDEDDDDVEAPISDERVDPSRRGRKYRSRANSDD
ncbi:hypothetical protein MA16_Dca025924 [Dendrobium catenatum]|uniref:U5 small nuclear ribonucleoprotein TSSC4 n=1 Tax=Dendrobium catenatum TaxID=906689 RepID=A0A2I0VAW9_9ASPA|nr:hypothetical protein MA16_Dca025924 [Dendrobium catenatum]